MTGRGISAPRPVIYLVLLAGCARIVGGNAPSVPDTTGPELSPPRSAPTDGSGSGELFRIVHERINAYRTSRGLHPLVLDPELTWLAEEHSRRMAVGQVPFGHDGFEQRAQTIRRIHSRARVGENVAWNRGHADPAETAAGYWLRSSPHLENLAGDFQLTGIGVAANVRGEYYFTQIFLDRSP